MCLQVLIIKIINSTTKSNIMKTKGKLKVMRDNIVDELVTDHDQ